MHTPTLPGGARVALGGESAALLVAREDDADLVGAGERLVQFQRAAAGIGEDHVDALADQALDDGIGAFDFRAGGCRGLGGGRSGFFMVAGGKRAVTKDERFPEWQAWFSQGTMRRLERGSRRHPARGQPAGMGAESGAETGQPEIAREAAVGCRRCSSRTKRTEGLLMLPWALSTAWLAASENPGSAGADGVEHVAPAGMDQHGGGRRGALVLGEKLGHRGGRLLGHGAVQEVAQFAIADLEAKQIAFLRQVERAESVAAERGRPRPAAPDGGGGAVAEQAGADQHAVVVIEVERRRADLHRHAGDDGLGLRGQQVTGRPQRRDRRAAAQADQVVQDGVRPQAQAVPPHNW